MAVASYYVAGSLQSVRNFMVPKRAGELKYWWKAARSAIPLLPDWKEVCNRFTCQDIDVMTIILEWQSNELVHRVIIARKKTLG